MVFAVITRQCSQKRATKHSALNALIVKHSHFEMVHSIQIIHALVKVAFRLEMVAMVVVAVLVVTPVYFILSDWEIQQSKSM